ncbi:hypothetical protein [Clostridium sp. BL-8]|uniref:hypothetical protein n=1 Tax=Clostridium sp. BL-8 TaxID=349938 RepID=UPI00098C639D|nr:hypothetical protein [Clostridium sp. BL-8]OOM69520.1 hypothetical protein CLOBL_52180 [Clostridium sp. BL-8]
MGKYLYLAVTADEFELPLAVEESIVDLAHRFDIEPSSLSHCINNGYNGKRLGKRFLKVKF